MALAMLNAGLVAGLAFAGTWAPDKFLLGVLAGLNVGAVVWIPTLIATLVCFGLPIAWSRRLAARGLASEERAERIVGSTCVAVSVLASLLVCASERAIWAFGGRAAILALAAIDGSAGAVSTFLVRVREARRRAFVARVQQGDEPDYRVDAARQGRVRVRVACGGKSYRVSDFEEPIARLDASAASVAETKG